MGNDLMGNLEMKLFTSFLRDESGASAAEYALILAIVGAGIALAASNLGDAIETAIANTETEVEAYAP